MFNREIFRKEAIEKLSTPDDLDELLQVNSGLSWLLLVSALCLIAGAVIWGIFGQIADKVSLTGTIQPVNPPQSLIATESGQVDSVFHWPGDRVSKDQPIIGYTQDKNSGIKYIVSPVDGELVELNVSEGLFLTPGLTVAKVSFNQAGQIINPEFLFFVSGKMVRNLSAGMDVNILIGESESGNINIHSIISYIGNLPASEESINSVIIDREVASQLKKGSYYLVRTSKAESGDRSDPLAGYSASDLYGKVLYGEVIVSKRSPIGYLFSPSK
jgi:hypothetical protein